MIIYNNIIYIDAIDSTNIKNSTLDNLENTCTNLSEF